MLRLHCLPPLIWLSSGLLIGGLPIDAHVHNLATAEGRQLLQRYWSDSIINQRRWKLPTAVSCLKHTLFGRTIYLSNADHPIAIDYTLGLRFGFRVWMEEIIYKHFANTIQALVYLGAVVLLTFVGLRFANLIDERQSLIGIGLEALMLFLLFIVMYFTPEEEFMAIGGEPAQQAGDDTKAYLALFREIYDELQDIGTMNAALGRHLTEIANKQELYLRELAQRPGVGAAPQVGSAISREGIAEIASLNQSVRELNAQVGSMNRSVERLLGKEVEYYVRREFERVFTAQIPPAPSNDLPAAAGATGRAEHEAADPTNA